MNNNNGNNGGNNGGGNNSPSQATATTSSASGSSTTSPSRPGSVKASTGLAGKYVAAIAVCSVLVALVVISVLLLCYFRRRRRVADQALTDRAADNPARAQGLAAYFQGRGRQRLGSSSRALAGQWQPSADMTATQAGQVLPDGTVVGSDEWVARMELLEVPRRGEEGLGMVERGSMTTPFDRQMRAQGDAGLRGAVEGGGVTQEEAPVGEGEVLPSYQQATLGRRIRGFRLPR